MFPKALFQKKCSMGILLLNDPTTLNAMDEEMCFHFNSIIEELLKDSSDISLLIVRGAQGNFSSGGNLNMLKRKSDLSPIQAEFEMRNFYEGFLRILHLPVPTVAVIEGVCVGAAVGLALSCDFRLGVGEVKISVPFLKLGLHPGMGVSALLPTYLGEQLSSFYILSGELVSKEHLASTNFFLKNFSDEKDCSAFLEKLSEDLKSLSRDVLQQTLSFIRSRKLDILQSQLALESKSQAINFHNEFFREKIKRLISTKTGTSDKTTESN
jgi:enoyl-CoA hydratase/carnithine racemase